MKKKNYFFDMLVVGVIGGLYAIYSQWRTDRFIDEQTEEMKTDLKKDILNELKNEEKAK